MGADTCATVDFWRIFCEIFLVKTFFRGSFSRQDIYRTELLSSRHFQEGDVLVKAFSVGDVLIKTFLEGDALVKTFIREMLSLRHLLVGDALVKPFSGVS